MKTLQEVREYNFDDNTKILVKLDRASKTASLVEMYKSGEYVPKEYIFANRGPEYMNGWLNILMAMEYVVKDCKKIMDGWEQEDTDKVIKLLAAVSDLENQ